MKIKMKKTTLISILIVTAVAVAFAIILPIYLKANEENRDIYNNHKIRILKSGEVIGEYSLAEMLELSPSVDFQATYKPSNALPVEKTYTGIYLKDLLTALEINLSEATQVNFKAMDGFPMVYSISDIMEENNVYIAYKVEDKFFNKGINSLASTKPEEDGGVFVVIKAKDATSQNRVKLLVEIDIV